MATTEKTNKTKVKRIFEIILNVVLWVFLAFATLSMIFALVSTSNDYRVPIMGNKVLMSVRSESMEPVIYKGDLIAGTVLSLDEKKELKEGDIITFFVDLDSDGTKEINTHRIVSVNVTGDTYVFRTKGDNNLTADGYEIRIDDIISKWQEGDTQIHGLGNVFAFLQSRLGFLLFVLIPLIALFAYEIVRLVLMIIKIKMKDHKEISEAEKEAIRRLAIEEYKKSLEEGKKEESNGDQE